MKKNILSSILLLVGLSFFSACEDDRDSNPTVQQPTEFVLNTPAYAGTSIDLETSTGTINMNWSQPNYGFPIVATYYVQVSTNGSFTHSVDEADADKTGSTVADYVQLDGVTSCSNAITPAILDKALNQLCKWEEGTVPETLDLHIRVKSCINSASQNGLYEIISNVVNMTVEPYYMVLKDALPAVWYLTGNCIGDCTWNNSDAGIGTALIPMSIVKDFEYDKKTGSGQFIYTGYFPANAEFKIVKTPGDWNNYVFCGGGAPGKTSLRKGGDDTGNITVPSAGYYKITVDDATETCTIEAFTETPKLYEAMCITGDFTDSWSDVEMYPASSADKTPEDVAAHNHIWIYPKEGYFKLETGSGIKFKIAGSWDTNWGAEAFPYGIGVNGGPNIPAEAGEYKVVFNDIDGSFHFLAK